MERANRLLQFYFGFDVADGMGLEVWFLTYHPLKNNRARNYKINTDSDFVTHCDVFDQNFRPPDWPKLSNYKIFVCFRIIK